jgi:hypothetical protein
MVRKMTDAEQAMILALIRGKDGEGRELLPRVYSLESGIYHYRSMAKTNYPA